LTTVVAAIPSASTTRRWQRAHTIAVIAVIAGGVVVILGAISDL
jgi:hypothetical protein